MEGGARPSEYEELYTILLHYIPFTITWSGPSFPNGEE